MTDSGLPRAALARLASTVDFRSDTVTKPTRAIADAMHAAALDADAVGDDVYGEDPTITRLERTVAELLGKDAAVFVPTCTMANLLAVGAHCSRGDEVFLGSESHIYIYEQGGSSWIMGAPFHAIANAPDGTLPLATLDAAISGRGRGVDAHMPRPGLVCVENTQNRCGGTVLPVDYMDALAALSEWRRCSSVRGPALHDAALCAALAAASKHGLPLHCDGARLLNASTALGIAPARLVAGCTTVSLCLSKGLGAPLGALLVGAAPVVARARRLRKAVGGGMRQAGVVAAAGLAALAEQGPLLGADHVRASALAAGLHGVPGVVAPAAVESNIVYFSLQAGLAAAHWHARVAAARAAGAATVVDPPSGAAVPLDAVPAAEESPAAAFAALLRELANVRVGALGGARLRAVTHHQVGDVAVSAFLGAAAVAGRLLAAP